MEDSRLDWWGLRAIFRHCRDSGERSTGSIGRSDEHKLRTVPAQARRGVSPLTRIGPFDEREDGDVRSHQASSASVITPRGVACNQHCLPSSASCGCAAMWLKWVAPARTAPNEILMLCWDAPDQSARRPTPTPSLGPLECGSFSTREVLECRLWENAEEMVRSESGATGWADKVIWIAMVNCHVVGNHKTRRELSQERLQQRESLVQLD